MNHPSLQSLLDRADEFIKSSSATTITKEAQGQPRDHINDVAELLAGASSPVTVPVKADGEWTEIEKTAMALNALNAAAEIDTIKRMEKFAALARAEGYPEDMICEAMTKISAGKVAENLGTLVSIGVSGFAKKDKNSGLLAKRKLPVGIGHQPSVSNAKGLGY